MSVQAAPLRRGRVFQLSMDGLGQVLDGEVGHNHLKDTVNGTILVPCLFELKKVSTIGAREAKKKRNLLSLTLT